jgi:hypothetical protein
MWRPMFALLFLALDLKMGWFLKTRNIYLSRKLEPFGSSEWVFVVHKRLPVKFF